MVVEMKILSGSFMWKRRSDKNYINLPWLFWQDNAKKAQKCLFSLHYLDGKMKPRQVPLKGICVS
jgi:hypothetical protein